MEWKKGIPIIPGYYWVHTNDAHDLIIVDVDGGVFETGVGRDVSYGEEEEFNSYYWLGPIEIPKAPTAGGHQ